MRATEKGLGISFGTAFCRAGWVDSYAPAAGDVAVECDATPAAFYCGPDGLAFGSAALRMIHEETSRQSVRNRVARDLGNQSLYHFVGRDYSPSQVTSLILKDLRERAERKAGGGFVRAVIAYPVWFDAVAETALRDAFAAAGLNNATLVTQAEAVTVAFRRVGHDLGDRVLVIDIGAVSTDLSVLALEASGSYAVAHRPRSVPVGGDDLDRALYMHIVEVAKRQAGHDLLDAVTIELGALHACRLAKEALSQSDCVTFEHTLRNGSATVMGIPLTRAEFEGLARPKLEVVFRAAVDVLAAAAGRGRPVGTVILTGGGSLMPLVQRLAHAELSVDAVLVDHDGTAAAIGAAWTAANCPSTIPLQDTTMNVTSQPKAQDKEQDNLESLLNNPDYAPVVEEARLRQLTFLITGRTGVGKSSTINSLVGRKVAPVGDFEPTTFQVQPYPVELQNGVKFNVVDTPGLCDDLAEKGNDIEYINRMRDALPKGFHSLWFVTELNAQRVGNDEKRAIRLISTAFQDKGAVWKSAVIVFTFAGRVSPADYSTTLAKRTELIRREIALHAGEVIATNVPSVAVENTADTTPDGNPWRGEFYVRVMTTMKREGIITYLLGIRVDPPKPRQQQHADEGRRISDRSDEYEPRSRRRRDDYDNEPRPLRSSDFTPTQVRTVERTARQELISRYESGGRAIAGEVGAWVGNGVGRLVAWWKGL